MVVYIIECTYPDPFRDFLKLPVVAESQDAAKGIAEALCDKWEKQRRKGSQLGANPRVESSWVDSGRDSVREIVLRITESNAFQGRDRFMLHAVAKPRGEKAKDLAAQRKTEKDQYVKIICA